MEPHIKLDTKDKKILKLISYKGRMSIADISRKTGIQRDSVMYRIKRLEHSKVIRFFHVVMDPVKLGYPVYTFVHFVLYNLKKGEEKSFIGYLEQHPHVTYVAKTTGKWDITINIATKDLTHFDTVMSQIRLKYSHIIKEYETASIIKEHKFDYMVDLI